MFEQIMYQKRDFLIEHSKIAKKLIIFHVA